jgi:hypothetical protein
VKQRASIKPFFRHKTAGRRTHTRTYARRRSLQHFFSCTVFVYSTPKYTAIAMKSRVVTLKHSPDHNIYCKMNIILLLNYHHPPPLRDDSQHNSDSRNLTISNSANPTVKHTRTEEPKNIHCPPPLPPIILPPGTRGQYPYGKVAVFFVSSVE